MDQKTPRINLKIIINILIYINNMNNDTLCKYNTAASICNKVWLKIKDKVIKDNERNLNTLTKFGNILIINELNSVYKKEKEKHIAFPLSIYLNNCMGNYIYDNEEPLDKNNNFIKDNDIIKVELGISIGGCISILADTFTVNKNKEIENINEFLSKLQKTLLKKIKHEECADNIRIFIESQCTYNNIFPVENCISYQHDISELANDSLKYMILNYHKYYDKDDYLIGPENINYEFEENDIYTINLSVIPIRDNVDDNSIRYKQSDNVHIYRINDLFHSLKLKSSKSFYNQVKKDHKNYAFNITPYILDIKHRMGVKECVDKNVMEKYPITYIKPDDIPVIVKKFTIFVGKEKSILLK
jgi:methionine aminopeptidase